jgi:hypothetical protein
MKIKFEINKSLDKCVSLNKIIFEEQCVIEKLFDNSEKYYVIDNIEDYTILRQLEKCQDVVSVVPEPEGEAIPL